MRKLTTCLVALCATTALWAAFTPAAFTVSADGKQVYFSQGNLQCSGVTTGEYVWSFAENQYDMIGTANVSGGTESYDATYGYSKSGDALADKIDLFGWSADNETAKWGISTSTSSSDYSGDFVDWGKNIGDGNTYRTPTYAEWDYLLNTRDNAESKRGVARINLNSDGTEYANGLILLPDDWTAPADVTFKSGFSGSYSVQAYADYQTFTLTEWQQLEAAGAVFLPASGYRNGSGVDDVQYDGGYWFATASGSSYASYLYFNSYGADADADADDGSNRSYGQAVRLVKDISSPVTALQPTESITLYTENGRIICAHDFQIFDLLGRNVTRLNGSLNGIYIVKVGDKAQKVVVSSK